MKPFSFLYLSLIMVLLVCFAGCNLPFGLGGGSSGALDGVVLPVGSLWDATASAGGVIWDSADIVTQELHSGYLLARQSSTEKNFQDKEYSEGNQQDDLQLNMRSMVEQDQVVAVIGGTTNTGSMRAASLVNFFNVPMIVPSASGDNLLPSTNLWAFRLSAPGSAYASYFFDTLIKGSLTASAAQSTPTPSAETVTSNQRMKLAILFEENTFGESAAVATAHAAMKQNLDIVVYQAFPANNPEVTEIKKLVEKTTLEYPDIVYMISDDLSVTKMLIGAFKQQNRGTPMLLGQAGSFATRAFLSSPEAEGVYVLRQKLDRSNCPADILSTGQAQNYAATILLHQSIQQAGKEIPKNWNPFASQTLDTTKRTTLREKIRDQIKTFNSDLPCIGKVAFDNAGQNKLLQFEIVTVSGGMEQVVPFETFQKLMIPLSQ